jgi:hypothetical protein
MKPRQLPLRLPFPKILAHKTFQIPFCVVYEQISQPGTIATFRHVSTLAPPTLGSQHNLRHEMQTLKELHQTGEQHSTCF